MMNELWKAIEGYDGIYEISNLGRVRSVTTRRYHGGYRPRLIQGRLLTPQIKKQTKYLSIQLTPNTPGKQNQHLIHILVATAFIGPKPTINHEVNHIDGNRQNAKADNLEWLTRKENIKHKVEVLERGNMKLNKEQVKEIKYLLSLSEKIHGRYPPIAKQFGVSVSTISLIANNRTWTHV